jgi:hypothetical protein
MLETKEAGQARPTLPGAATGAAFAKPGPAHTPRFAVAAHSDNVVLVDIVTGRSWALALDEHQPVWQPVLFAGQAERAPPFIARDKE